MEHVLFDGHGGPYALRSDRAVRQLRAKLRGETDLPPDKRTAVFSRYQQFRKFLLTKFGEAREPSPVVCVCGALKTLSATYCHACRDAKLIISHHTAQPHSTKSALAAVKAREPDSSKVYPTPLGNITSKYVTEEMSAAQENAIRILEDG
jgi:hypothetical protein